MKAKAVKTVSRLQEVNQEAVLARLNQMVGAKLVTLGDPTYGKAPLPEGAYTVFITDKFMRWAGLEGARPYRGARWIVQTIPQRVEKGDPVLPDGGLGPAVYASGWMVQYPDRAKLLLDIGRAIRRFLTLGGEKTSNLGTAC